MLMATARWIRSMAWRAGIHIDRYPPNDSFGGELRRLVRFIQPDAAFDIGAHHGESVRWLRRIGYRGPIVSCEPVEETFRALASVASRDAAWTTLRTAVGPTDGTGHIHIMDRSDLASMLAPRPQGPDDTTWSMNVRETRPVPVTRLETLMREHEPDARAVLVKIDVQGMDLLVLKSAGEEIHRVAGIVLELPLLHLYEDTPTLEETLAYLRDLRFGMTGLSQISRDIDGRIIELDAFFRRLPRRQA